MIRDNTNPKWICIKAQQPLVYMKRNETSEACNAYFTDTISSRGESPPFLVLQYLEPHSKLVFSGTTASLLVS